MLIKLYEENPEQKKVDQVIEILKRGGTIIYPTDSVYSLGCDLYNHKAIQKVASIQGVKTEKSHFTLLFNDLSSLSDYTLPFDTWVYKLMKKALPGPFTFILKANSNVPKIFKSKKIKPSDFNSAYSEIDVSYKEVRSELKPLLRNEISEFLVSRGFQVFNINYIEKKDEVIELQYYHGSSMECEFYNCRIIDLASDPKLIPERDGILEILD